MKMTVVLAACAVTLAGCSATRPITTSEVFFNNGNDTTFERVGAQSCPAGTVQSGLTGDTRNPLRCGPQQQRVP